MESHDVKMYRTMEYQSFILLFYCHYWKKHYLCRTEVFNTYNKYIIVNAYTTNLEHYAIQYNLSSRRRGGP